MKWAEYNIIDADELKRLKTSYTHSKRVVNNIAGRLDDDYYIKTLRDMKDSEMLVCTKTRAKIKRSDIANEKSKMIIDESDFFKLAEIALTHCKGCTNDNYTSCVVRNCGMELQIPPVDAFVVDECQYKF
jgi:hypothetical protein